jgi:hypothetical protein
VDGVSRLLGFALLCRPAAGRMVFSDRRPAKPNSRRRPASGDESPNSQAHTQEKAMPPTFTKLARTQDFYDEYVKKRTELGVWQDGVNSDPWSKYALDLVMRIEKVYAVYEKESKDYFTWLDQKLANCKSLSAESVTLAGALGQNFDDTKFARLNTVKQLMDADLAEIAQVRQDMRNHQGFRGNLGFDTKDGAPLRLEKYEEVFKAKRKVFIDQNEATGIKIDKARNEYTTRVTNAITLATKYKTQAGKEIVVAHDELMALKTELAAWHDMKSAKNQGIVGAIKKVEDFLKDAEAKPKTVTKASFASVRTNFPTLKKAVDAARANLNTDLKRFEAIKSGLGAALYDKKVLDQKLVKDVEGGFLKWKEILKGLTESKTKELEVKISKLEKKLLG